MKTAITITVIFIINFVLYYSSTLFPLDRIYHIAFVNIAIFIIIIAFFSSDFIKYKEVLRLRKELNKINFRVEDEQKEIQILHALDDISESFVHETHINVIFEQTLLAIRKILQADIAVLFLCDHQTKAITQQIYNGAQEFEVDKPALERIIHRGNAVLINRISTQHTEFNNYIKLYEQGFKSIMVAPITMKEKVIGLLGIFTKSDVDFSAVDLRILSTFCTHVSIIMENGRLLEETQQLAITDGLTQLFNHRYFQQRLKEEFSRAERYEHPLSLVIFDIDYFKNYNDSHGHPMGDVILKEISSLLKSNIRPTDFAARYGGEEFVILVVETDKKGAELFAEKFRKTVETTHFEHQEQQPNKNLTISLGVANFPADAHSPQELINMADKALYKAKESGRNQVKVYIPEENA